MSSTNSLPSVSTLSITNGGTSEVLLTADAARKSLFVQPKTEACLVNFGATAGAQATGTLTFGTNPSDNETIDVNGVSVVFESAGPTTDEVLIGATKELTAAAFAAMANASATAGLAVATYSASGNVVTITYDAGGTDGNAFTLANSSGGNVTRSAATLAGGSNTVGGIYLAQYQSLIFSSVDMPQIKEAVYVLSATNSAKIDYFGGNE